MEDVDLAALTRRAQQQGAIDGIEEYANRLTDEGPEFYMKIKHDLIAEIENDTANTD